MSYASLGGQRIVKCDVTIPMVGMWTADVTLASAFSLPTAVSLVIADLVLAGAVYRTDAFAGIQIARVVGGAGGWRKTIPASKYTNPLGIKVSMVLGDAAKVVGETVSLASDSTLGVFYSRDERNASAVLRELTGSLWWVDAKGVTQCGTSRDASPIRTPFLLEDFDPGIGLMVVSTENPADWMPGRTITAPTLSTPRTLSLVRHVIDDSGNLRTEALAA